LGAKRNLPLDQSTTGFDPGSRHRANCNPAAQQPCANLSVGSTGSTGSEAAQVHYAPRRRDSRVAARGALAQEKNRLVVAAHHNLGAMTVDPSRRRQMLLHLISYAYKVAY